MRLKTIFDEFIQSQKTSNMIMHTITVSRWADWTGKIATFQKTLCRSLPWERKSCCIKIFRSSIQKCYILKYISYQNVAMTCQKHICTFYLGLEKTLRFSPAVRWHQRCHELLAVRAPLRMWWSSFAWPLSVFRPELQRGWRIGHH